MSDEPDPTWHVYYRTAGMSQASERGFRRLDIQAPDAETALDETLAKIRNVNFARVYPAASALVVSVTWESPTIEIRHEPHPMRIG